ncbi:MAG: DUF1801 domain-containing protein [Fimbriimonadaceae bacterium]|nr:DUF1801 domain-containing protein [Chitinophagales bacterium]
MIKGSVANTVDAYIGAFPENVRNILDKLRQTIKKAAPGAEEVISYKMPAYKYHGMLVYFAAYENHIGFYPTPSAIEAFKKELSAYEGAKGSIKFPINKPLPFKLISGIVEFKVKENEVKQLAASNKKSALKKPGNTNKKINKSTDADSVNEYMNKLEHPLKDEMEVVRKIIKGTNKKLSERIKWSAPSYHYNNTDLITFNHRNEKAVQLVFHHPSIVKIKSPLLTGDYKDRRLAAFKNMQEVKANKKELERIITELIKFIEG